MSAKYAYKERVFLNQSPELSAFIIAVVEKFKVNPTKGTIRAYPTLDIADCSSKISLDFSFYDKEDRASSLRKAKLIQKVINNFVEAIESEITEAEDKIKNHTEKKEQTKK